jgi:hypothetical protein
MIFMIRAFGAPRHRKSDGSDGIYPREGINVPQKPNKIPDAATQPFKEL